MADDAASTEGEPVEDVMNEDGEAVEGEAVDGEDVRTPAPGAASRCCARGARGRCRASVARRRAERSGKQLAEPTQPLGRRAAARGDGSAGRAQPLQHTTPALPTLGTALRPRPCAERRLHATH